MSRVIKKQPLMVWYSPGISLTRIHYDLYTYRVRTQDRARPIKSQLDSNELLKHAHWAMSPLDHQLRHSTVSYSRWSGTMFPLQSTHT